MRVKIAVVTIFVLSIIGGLSVQAQFPPPPTFFPRAYIPVVKQPLPPPADPELLVLRPEDLGRIGLGLDDDTQQRVSNEEAALASSDPTGARQAFASQGRLTAYFIRYITDSFFEKVIGISNQVIIYETAEGASAALDYHVAKEEADGFLISSEMRLQPADRTTTLVRSEKQDRFTYVTVKYVIQRGIYVSIVQIIGRSPWQDPDIVEEIAQSSADKLPARESIKPFPNTPIPSATGSPTRTPTKTRTNPPTATTTRTPTRTDTAGPRMTSTRDLSTATTTLTPSRTSTWSSNRATFTPVIGPSPTTGSSPYYTNGQDIYNCSDFATWSQANAVYQANRVDGDPNKLDSDGDGIPCESLPGAP
jgi:hypothetical protein